MIFGVDKPSEFRAPIVVTSPTPRSGTTLVQRLICSSQNGVCFGENVAERLFDFSKFAEGVNNFVETHRERGKLEWEKLLSGDSEFWMVSLELPGDQSKNAALIAYYAYMQYHAVCAAQLGRPVWGAKSPAQPVSSIGKLSQFFPNTKCIYVYRNVFDVVKSCKSRDWIKSEEDLRRYCSDWVRNTEIIAALKTQRISAVNRLITIEYERIISHRDEVIDKIEAFTGLNEIKRSVLDQKVNTWSDDVTLKSKYLEPAGLTVAEVEIITELCGAQMEVLYPNSN